ncbi:MAG: glycosyltransferase, partial [Actinomycetota bacterium]|nr:glycosyltransferase [Actinomycetota bacterium]
LETHLVFPREPDSRPFVRDVSAALHVVASPAGVRDPGFALGLGKLLRSLRPTHLHAHFGLDAYEALVVAAVLRVPRRFASKHIVPSSSRASALRHRGLAALVEAIFAVSADVGRRLAALGVPARKLNVVPLGVDAAAYEAEAHAREAVRAELGIGPDVRLLLSTSHLRPGKGVELLPHVTAALAVDPGGVCLLLAGDGPLRGEVEAEARRLGLGREQIRFLGVREDVPQLLAAADLFLFPTVGTEGYPLGPLEALASGLPAVASAIGDLATSLADVAELVPPGDVAAIVAACRRLLADPVRAAELATAGRRLVADRFSVSRAAAEHAAVYGAARGEARPA